MLEEVGGGASVSHEAALGLVAFVNDGARSRTRSELTERGWLLVELSLVQREARGNLAERIDAAVELALGLRGAEPAGIGLGESLSEADARLSDQLFRARRLGAPGVVLSLPPLAGAATGTGVLEAEDGAILQFLALAANERPLVMLLDESDEQLAAYTRPVPLTALLRSSVDASYDEPAPATEDDGAHEAYEAYEAYGAYDGEEDDDAVTEVPPAVAITEPSVFARTDSHAVAEEDREVQSELDDAEEPGSATFWAAEAALDDEERAGAAQGEPVAPEPEPVAPEPESIAAAIAAEPPIDWRKHVNALNAAKGPKPLSALEELFAEHYMPLGRAIAGGLIEPRAASAYDDFGNAFAKAYLDAFPAFAVRSKRPDMVMDALDLAQKAARAAGAQRTVVVLVDALRHDVGHLLKDELGARLEGRATLVEERLLWSALPTNTPRQLETLARGIDALRAPQDLDIPTESLRGHAAELVRRVRVGSREFYKLDIVEARLATWKHAGAGGIVEVLPGIASSAASALERFALTQPPRTLLFVLGDHGFAFDADGELVAGGASPEEVLVPAFAWLLGELH